MRTKLSFDRIIWLFEKQENLRIHNTSRASTLITANSIVIAANTFILGRFWSGIINVKLLDIWYFNDILINLPIIISFSLSIISIYYALNSFIRHNKHSEDIVGKIPERLFVHSRDTFKKIHGFVQFESELNKTTEDDLYNYIVRDFYTVMKIHEIGYQKLRKSSRLFIQSLCFLFFNILVSTALPYIYRL